MGDAPEPGPDVGAGTQMWAERSLESLTALSGVRRAGLALLEGGGRRLAFTSAETGNGPRPWCYVDAYDDVPLNAAVRHGGAVVGRLEQLAPSFPAFVARQAGTGTTALAAVPIVAEGRVVGGFVLFYDGSVDPGREARTSLTTVGRDLGAELARARGPRRPAEPLPHAAVRGVQEARIRVECDPAAIAPVRRELRSTLTGWGVDADTVEAAALCMTELVTNAVVHARSGCWVLVSYGEDRLTVAVRSSGQAERLGSEVGEHLPVHGRGLQLVDAFTTSWGADREDGELSAWFVLEGRGGDGTSAASSQA